MGERVSGVFDTLWRRRRVLASGATVVVAAVVVSTLAFLYQGVPTADLKLNDGGVWVTKTNDQYLGHLNYASAVLDQAKLADSGDFDVLQSGDTVLVADQGVHKLKVLSPATLAWGATADLPQNAVVGLGGQTVGVVAGGRLFDEATGDLSGIAFDAHRAVADVGNAAPVAVTRDGSAVVSASPTKREFVVVPAGGAAQDVRTTPLAGLPSGAQLQVTAVGDQPVALDAAHGVVYRPDGSAVHVSGAQELQQAGPQNDAVYVTTRTALVRVPLDGGDPQTVRTVASGDPAQPVWLGGCAYAVWGGQTPHYARMCADRAQDVAQNLTGAVSGTSGLVLRQNRDVVVVNDTRFGGVWMVAEHAQKVDTWNQVIPKTQKQQQKQKSQQQKTLTLHQRDKQNHPPVAHDEQFGVRPGRQTLLPVTDQDSDPDGDVLSASLVGSAPAGYTVTPAMNGADLQVTVPATATGTVHFRYMVSDGRGGTAEATITLTVHPLDEVSTPKYLGGEAPQIQVEVGGSVSYDALNRWIDPYGDGIYLADAVTSGGDTVTFRPNGVIVFTPTSGHTGMKTVTITVSNGRKSATGVIGVDVEAKGTLAPVAYADRATVVAGQHVTISPLTNDLDPSGQPLRLAQVLAAPGSVATPNYTAGTVDFTAAHAGTYYVQYIVTDGAHQAIGLIRVDVTPPAPTTQPPVTVRAVAMLPAGGSTLVDVLADDYDPAGGILVVQGVTVPPGSPVSVQVMQHSILKIQDVGGLSAPLALTYTVSNGVTSAVGEVDVMPIPAPTVVHSPVAANVTATVRVGDVVTIPVLASDYDPDDLPLTLMSVDTSQVHGAGVAFVSGDTVRFEAGAKPGTVLLTYRIRDDRTPPATADGLITITVTPAGPGSAPQPQPVIARAIAGSTTRIPIPLDGIDPDGSSVQLVGLTSNPTLGTVVVHGTWLQYTAYPQAHGTDTFTYQVRSRLGLTGTSTVSVGVAPPAAQSQPPYAGNVTVTLRPNRTVAIPVMDYATDPSGGQLEGPTLVRSDSALNARVGGGEVLVTTPARSGTYTLTYRVADDFGQTAQGVVTVNVTPQAPLVPPVAADDYVSPSAVIGHSTVSIDVLANDSDPDGTVADLTVTVADSAATVHGGTVTLPVHASAQVVRYTDTNPDGLTGSAFIFVPGSSTVLPQLSTTTPVTVVSGQTATIALADHVRVRAGHTPRVAVNDVSTAHSDGSPIVKNATTLVYTPAKGYYGPDSIGVMVTDGTGPDDPKGLQGYVSIPILVVPDGPVAPTLRNVGVEVAPDEAPAVIDLEKLAYDPTPGAVNSLTYAISGSVPDGIRAAVDGAKLTVSATKATGAPVQFQVTATGHPGGKVSAPATVTVTVVASTRELAVAGDVTVIVKAGQTTTVDVLAHDHNPFPGKPLKLVSASAVDPSQGTAGVSGNEVAVTPRSGFHGTMTVTYRIADATGAADREVDGHVFATVQGKPGTPTTPSVVSVQNGTVVLSWATPPNNGAAIDGYRVTSSRGGQQQCTSTTCAITGLTNNVSYTFTVQAHNAVGYSDSSPASASARPDTHPDAPSAPAVTFGNTKLSIAWSAPASQGSPITGYTLQLSPAAPDGATQVQVSGTSYTWSGLANGTSYQVQVEAHNSAPDPSPWSAWSQGVVPAGPPGVPTSVTATFSPSVGNQAQIKVQWSPPSDDNGDAVSSYTVSAAGGAGGAAPQTVSGTSAVFNVATSTNGYTFSVTARNKAGNSASSVSSPSVRAVNAPDAPSNVSIQATGTAGQLKVTITPGGWNGNNPGDVSWQWAGSGGGQIAVQSASTSSIVGTINGAANGQSQSVQVWGTSTLTGGAGGRTGSNQASPWGPLQGYSPSVSTSGDQVCFGWNVGSGTLNGQTVSNVSYSAAGGASGTGGAAGNACSGHGYYQTRSFTMTVHTTQGNSATYTASGSTGVNPGRTATLSRGGVYTGSTSFGSCGSNAPTCYQFHVQLSGFAPNSTVNITCENTEGGGWNNWPGTTIPVQTDGSGSADTQNVCHIAAPSSANPWSLPYRFLAQDSYGTVISNSVTSW